MNKLFFRAVFLIFLAMTSAWCIDNVIITGTVMDSVKNVPVAGLRVVSMPTLFGAASSVNTTTDASGKYTLNNSGAIDGSAVSAYTVSTSYLFAYQYESIANIPVPASANRNDNVADTIHLNINVGSVTNPPDTLVINGKVHDTLNNPIKGVNVNFIFLVNSIFYQVPPNAPSYDTIPFTTDNNGAFSYRGLNIYAIKGGTFYLLSPLPSPFNYSANSKLKLTTQAGLVDNDSAHANIRDGNTDSMVPDFTLVPTTTAISDRFRNTPANVSFSSNPLTVSVYSADGRLVRKLNNIKIENLDNTLSSLNLHGGKVLFAVWNQNGMKCSKRIMNITRNKY